MSEFSELLLINRIKKNRETIFTSFSNIFIFVCFQTNVDDNVSFAPRYMSWDRGSSGGGGGGRSQSQEKQPLNVRSCS